MAIEGIDVYEGTGAIEWHRVAAAGVKFAYVRAAYGDRADKAVVQNVAGAKSAGIPCGIYHFYRVTKDPDTQAQAMLSALNQIGGSADLPPAIDVEDNPAYDGEWSTHNNAKMIEGIRNWIAKVQPAAGNKKPVIYTRAGFWATLGDPAGFAQNPLWVANYGVNKPRLPTGWAEYAFWQYSESGTVDGVNGHVDRNKSNLDAAGLGQLGA